MAKSSTIWVSIDTKKKADKNRGKMSYNKHYDFLIDRVKALESGKPVKTKTVVKKDFPLCLLTEMLYFIIRFCFYIILHIRSRWMLLL